MNPALVGLISGLGSGVSSIVALETIRFFRSRIWGLSQKKLIPIAKIHELINEHCDSTLYILASNPHWLESFTQLENLNGRIDVKILYNKEVQEHERVEEVITRIKEDWRIPIKGLPYIHAPYYLKGYIVDGKVYCLYEGARNLTQKNKDTRYGSLIKDPVLVSTLSYLFLDSFYSVDKMDDLENRIKSLETSAR